MAEPIRTWDDAVPPAPLAITHEQKYELALVLTRELRQLAATVRQYDRMPRHEQEKLEGVPILAERAEALRGVLELMTRPAPAPARVDCPDCLELRARVRCARCGVALAALTSAPTSTPAEPELPLADDDDAVLALATVRHALEMVSGGQLLEQSATLRGALELLERHEAIRRGAARALAEPST